MKKGFTLVELLVVIAIIGLLSTMAMLALTTARTRARDARRTTDVRAIQVALEIYQNNHGSYPADTVAGVGGAEVGTGNLQMLTSSGWSASLPAGSPSVYLGVAPRDPSPGNLLRYTYVSRDESGAACDDASCDTYNLTFSLEQGAGELKAGSYCAVPPATISTGACS